MAGSAKRYPKLRFALIPEDALEKLRPETKTKKTEPHQMEVKDMYETISNTVNLVLDQKLKNLRLDKLDQMIEEKVSQFHDRRRKSLRCDESPKSCGTEESIYTVPDYTCKPPKLRTTRLASPAPKEVRARKTSKKEPYTNDFPFKLKTSDCKPTIPNNKSGSGPRRISVVEMKKQDSIRDIQLKHFKDLHHRNKRKQ
ncbi:hypothetical protein AWZ03_011775 [Drosophila navojoa]|uniref:Uncharacterized protein n=1 Tax=Drosophila navojoa TaxID=7232 RepID=A0A484B1Y5_DRONA|nr:uncharacterized protein LOC108655917 [Drosophila navojoa]TDG41805.1 hypothetical protein AWZ03_011775 [Drosophila navojoa]